MARRQRATRLCPMQRNKSLMRSCLEWSDAYSVAHPALDAEHREIMLVIDRIAEAGDDHTRQRALLCELKETTAKHDAHLKTLFQTIRTDCPELLARLD